MKIEKTLSSRKILICMFIATLFMSIGYASINSILLDINGTAVAKDQKGIFIIEANYASDINAKKENSKIINAHQTMLNSSIELSDVDSNSEITYAITIYNSTNDTYSFRKVDYLIGETTYSNENIVFQLRGLKVGDTLNSKQSITFYITFSYKDDVLAKSNILKSYLNFKFAKNTFSNIILADNELSDNCPIKYENTDLYTVSSVETNNKFCKAHDNFGDTYYFRGKADNNYVSFAGYTWRIMRINGTGSVRLLYNGGIGTVNMGNEKELDNSGIGYMYGTPGQSTYENTHTNSRDSLLKKTLETWYQNNILGKYDDYIADMYFFNDRTTYQNFPYDSIVKNPVIYPGWGQDTGLGYGKNITFYGSWLRLVENIENYYSNNEGEPVSYPTFYCLNENDCYTSNNDIGYGINVLKYPIASVTMDDAIFAGNNYKEKNANDSSYIYYGERFHLLSFPVYENNFLPICSLMGVHSLGNGWITCGARGNFQVRPVINVKGELIVTSGDGTKDFPYTLTIKENEDSNLTDDIEHQIDTMTLKEKIGQMIIINASPYGTTLNSDFSNILTTVKPGGVIIMTSNISSYNQLTKLMSDVNATSTIPLIWSIDQEGGRVQRLTENNVGATTIPYMYYLGRTGNVNLAYDTGSIIGEELRVFGFNMDFAPVADVWSNSGNTVIGQRAFGTTPEIVSKMTIPFARGLESSGVTAVYKHFPGHGDTTTDSHYTLPVITKTKEELLQNEIVPFKNAIDNGAKVIMVGHLAVPAITEDDTVPASLSKTAITDFLKGELGFKGLVVTDGLNMDALNSYSSDELFVMAINAGVDLLLGPKDPMEALNVIYNAVESGKISEETINTSVRKILELKSSLLTEKLDKSYLGSQNHNDIISQIIIP